MADASEFYSRAFGPTTISAIAGAGPVGFRASLARLEGIAVMASATETGMAFQPAASSDDYSIVFSDTGRLDVETDRGSFFTQGEFGSIRDALLHRGIMQPGRSGLLVRVQKRILSARLTALCGRPVAAPAFRPVFVKSSAAGTALRYLSECLLHNARAAGPADGSDLADFYLGQSMIDLLLYEFRHDKSDLINRRVGGATSGQVKRALDYMHAHACERFTIDDLASVAGASVRSLQSTFRKETGLTPSDYLRRLRLLGVHQDILSAGSDADIAMVARKWGFFHLGKFARYYRDTYGCLPSETARSV